MKSMKFKIKKSKIVIVIAEIYIKEMSAAKSKFNGENKTFKAVQFLLNTKEAARRPSNFDVRDIEYSDKLRNISVSGDIEDLYKVNLQVETIHKTGSFITFNVLLKYFFSNNIMRVSVNIQGFQDQCTSRCPSFVVE